MKNGLYYAIGRIAEEIPDSMTLFDDEAARGIINNLK